eukprot:408394-Prymnesium_polylepis.1
MTPHEHSIVPPRRWRRRNGRRRRRLDPSFAPDSDGDDSAAEWEDGPFEDSEMTSNGSSDDDES